MGAKSRPNGWAYSFVARMDRHFGVASEQCEKCGYPVTVGDWPFCKGNAEDHRR